MPVIDLIKMRRGTAAQWTSANPVLQAGEPGFETDTGLMKVGNGTQAWTALPYTATQGLKGDAGPAGPKGDKGDPGTMPPLASDPASPTAGYVYFNTTSKRIRYYDGTTWYSTAALTADAVPFTDNFDRADSATVGNGWTDPQTAYEITGNKLGAKATAAANYDGYYVLLRPALSQTLQVIEYDAPTYTVEAGGNANGCIFGWVDSANFFYIKHDQSTNDITLRQVISGTRNTHVTVTTIPGGGVVAGNRIKVEADWPNKKVRVYVRGNLVIDYTSSTLTFTNSQVGINCFNPGGALYRWDYWHHRDTL